MEYSVQKPLRSLPLSLRVMKVSILQDAALGTLSKLRLVLIPEY